MNSEIKIMFQDDLVKILKSVKGQDEVSRVMEGTLPFNFAVILGDEEKISVIPDKYWLDYMAEPRAIRQKNAVSMKPGKFLVKLFPDATHQEIHKFLAGIQGGTIETVNGEDIRTWYHGDRYSHTESTDTLGASCMRHTRCQAFMDFYVQNPEVCSMAILKDLEGMLIGRALLWTAKDHDGNEHKILDRIYGTAKTVEKFKNWAKKNGYWHKLQQSYGDYRLVKDGLDSNASDYVITGNFICENGYPYMDTFDARDIDGDRLSANGMAQKFFDRYRSLKSTDGGIG